MKNTHREPILYIVGNEERADEIRHILKDEFGGSTMFGYMYNNSQMIYYVNALGLIASHRTNSDDFKEAVANGWMKEYKLPEKPKFEPFDRVVVRYNDNTWRATIFSHVDIEARVYKYVCINDRYEQCLPYNEQTAKLIGTKDEWKGGKE